MKSSKRLAGADSLFAANLLALVGPPAALVPEPAPLAVSSEQTRDAMMAPYLNEFARSANAASALAARSSSLGTFAEMTLDDALDELAAVQAFIARVQPELNAARRAAADLEAVAHLRLTERGARVYDGARLHCRYETRKSGTAGIAFPDALRAELEAINAAAIAENRPPLIPAKELDDALPRVTPPPVVKPDLRKTRKLAARGDVVRVILDRHIAEAKKYDALVIEPIAIDVTPSPPALMP